MRSGRKLVGCSRATPPARSRPVSWTRIASRPIRSCPCAARAVRASKFRPGLLTALGGADIPEPPLGRGHDIPQEGAGRMDRQPDHPLTARVMVNRIWQYHFGRGLVATPSDFGTRGMTPSHPELLDWLATEFVARGWSMKAMHKLIMTSDAYQRDSNARGRCAHERSGKHLAVAYFSRRRLSAEEVRDSVLQSSGTLNLKMGGRPVVPPQTNEELYGMSQSPDNFWPVSWNKEDHVRRSVYTLIRRSYRPPLMEAFDGPDGTLHCARRDESTVAPQSLTLMNSDFAYEQARAFAARLSKEGDAAEDRRAGVPRCAVP